MKNKLFLKILPRRHQGTKKYLIADYAESAEVFSRKDAENAQKSAKNVTKGANSLRVLREAYLVKYDVKIKNY